jgi:hypothetical protein
MPVGWSDWMFWQTSDTGSVSGIAGNVDTNLFNGELPKLKSLTLNGPPAPADPTSSMPASEDVAKPNDGSEGATMNDPNERPEAILAPSIATCK